MSEIQKKAVLVLGGTSSIGRSIAAALAEEGYPLYLASREEPDLNRFALDLQVKYGVEVKYGIFDAENCARHALFLQQVVRTMNGLKGVVLAFGSLGDHQQSMRDFQAAEKVIAVNYLAACSILTHCANFFEKQKSGFIIGIGSVAGDRGRQSNYIYGSAKAGLEVFLQGLRNRLFASGVEVMTVKPGFVDSAMTFGMPGLFLVAAPASVGKAVAKSLKRSRNCIYVPWFWRPIMGMVRSIPEVLFKRMKL
jgi:decaprenylphospho-beta-D-erythro-pentofuranosid-2-ulose 2-reductase